MPKIYHSASFFSVFALALSLAFPAKPASADSLTITYFTIAANDKDANHLAGGLYDNQVQSTLGVNGLPILNTAAYGCIANCYNPVGAPTDVLSDGEITYWNPTLNNGGAAGASDLTLTSTQTTALPFSNNNFFAPNGTGACDGGGIGCFGYQAAMLSGTLDAPTTENISFTLDSDDMAFVYLDGNLVCSDGGVHPDAAGSCTTASMIPAGSHTLQLFYVDINTNLAALNFGVTTEGVTTRVTPPTDPPSDPTVPEPTTLMLFATGLVGIARTIHRRLAR